MTRISRMVNKLGDVVRVQTDETFTLSLNGDESTPQELADCFPLATLARICDDGLSPGGDWNEYQKARKAILIALNA